MRPGRKFFVFYFVFLGVLSAIAMIPTGALILLLITSMALPLYGVPGFLALASPTVLLYSIALVPLWMALTAPRRRIWLIAPAASLPVILAIAPGMISQQEAKRFGMQVSNEDTRRPAVGQPRSIEINGDGTSGMFETVGDSYPSCNEVCRRLLFNGEADWVRMTRVPDLYMHKRDGTTKSVTYHIEHRTSCPQVQPDGIKVEREVRERLVAGDCLIAETGSTDAPDASVIFTTRYHNQQYPIKTPDDGPNHATIVSVKDLRIDTRQDGALTPVLKQTETVALAVARPFYIGSEEHMQGGYNGPTVGRVKVEMNPVNLAQTMRDTLGYKIAAISAPPLEDARKTAERVVALPLETSPTLSAQQQDAVNDVMAAMAKQPVLSDADVGFIGGVIADKRITEAKLGIEIQNMFRRLTLRLEPLIPVVLDRIAAPAPQQATHYQSMLGWSLTFYSDDSLRPYRDKMVAVVEAQEDFASSGVLTRLAALGSEDGVRLTVRRLDSTAVRQFAAIAACRASAEAWPVLEPAVLAHLTPPRRGTDLQDDERPLLLALVRFGKKQLVADMIESRGLFDKKRTFERLAKFEPGFAPEHCRDYL